MSVFAGPQGSAAAASGYPKKFLTGLALRYSSATAIIVEVGSARDKDNAADIDLAAETTVAITTLNAAAGLERKTLTGTVSTDSGNANVTGSGTAFLTELAPGNAPRALSAGTIGTGGGSSTTITGTSTVFLSDVSVGDLIGNATVGYSRVTAIASNVSLTVVSALTITDGATGLVVENAIVQVASQTVQRVNAVSSNTAMVLAANSSATASGAAIVVGAEAVSAWYAVWLAKGDTGTTAILSTQRTTPLGSVTGYTTSYRRIGWCRNNSSGDIQAFSVSGGRYHWETAASATALLSGGGSTSWAALDASASVPATARSITVSMQCFNPASANISVYVRPRNIGVTTVDRPRYSSGRNAGDGESVSFTTSCDGAQFIDYAISAADANNPAYIHVEGFSDDGI